MGAILVQVGSDLLLAVRCLFCLNNSALLSQLVPDFLSLNFLICNFPAKVEKLQFYS